MAHINSCSSEAENRAESGAAFNVSFADVAHQTLSFEASEPDGSLVLALIDTRWMQRLRNIRQTGNTNLVYMFAEHSRFGHSLGVAYLAITLMRSLSRTSPQAVKPFQEAVAVAALLHDLGHTAPGSHLAERVWSDHHGHHESTSLRIIREDSEIQRILNQRNPALVDRVCGILSGASTVPPWTKAIISGGGWNADRGNWTIVDSAMCSVSYGRYNVLALLDAFRLSDAGDLVLQESRLDALTHFFVARDSMYRQVYQHRVLQAVDALTERAAIRLLDLIEAELPHQQQLLGDGPESLRIVQDVCGKLRIFCDDTLASLVVSKRNGVAIPLDTIFNMTESWWGYHRDRWCSCDDPILSDLAQRLRDRKLLKTIRLERRAEPLSDGNQRLLKAAQEISSSMGYDPRYYVAVVHNTDMHRGKQETPPLVLLDNGEIVPVTTVEPMIAEVLARSRESRSWLVVPKGVKQALGIRR